MMVADQFSPRGISWDLEVGRAAVSMDQSPLATSSGVSSSGWTVCYSGDKSRDSGMAIS